ncbi:unnamed protein product [Urochloa decumbens]|uniref:Protein kinase domain-containing protein n=1 Tax=Urochloa decumbens TaxID=240449 RepID=A0ABC8XZW5_9POAL
MGGCSIKIRFQCLCPSSKDDSAAARATPAPSGNSREVAIIAADVPKLTVRELKKATDKFSASKLIARGAHAEVFRATLPGDRAAAAKRLIIRTPEPDGSAADAGIILKQQVAVASRLRHDNVVRLLGYNITADLPVLLYELAGVGTLHDALHGPEEEAAPALRLSWEQRVRIALDAARGLAYLHEAALPVAHHDVRSSNVLLFEGLRAKIAGHNVFKELEVWNRRPVSRLTAKSDVYSFGVVLLELLTGRKPFDDTLPRDQHILDSWAAPLLAEGRVEECIDPKLGDQYPPAGALKLGRIAVQCLHVQPTSRPSMDTVARLINCDVIMQHQHGVV